MRRILVQISGGKDSIVTLHMALQKNAQVTAIYNNMGDAFPHMVDYIHAICVEWNVPLIISSPPRSVLDTVLEDGLPSDIVPVWASQESAAFVELKGLSSTKLQSGLQCCNKHLYQPLMEATNAFKPDAVWRGSRKDDEHVTYGPKWSYMGIDYWCPIWNFTEEDVFKYIEAHSIKLPRQYDYGVVHSLDCMHCTAWLNSETERGRLSFTSVEYPVEFKNLRSRLNAVEGSIIMQTEQLKPAFELIKRL